MILGMSLSAYTQLHVILSLVGIGAGLVVLAGMFTAGRLPAWTAAFLVTTLLTGVTGYFFPRDQVLPSHVVGAVTVAVATAAALAVWRYDLAGAWRWIYVVAAIAALYLNSFVGLVQAFLKVPSLHLLAPTQSDPAFVLAQLGLLVIFVAAGFLAVGAFRPGPPAGALHRA
jgi:hypothetical protein